MEKTLETNKSLTRKVLAVSAILLLILSIGAIGFVLLQQFGPTEQGATEVVPNVRGIWGGEWIDELGLNRPPGHVVPIQLNVAFQEDRVIRGILTFAAALVDGEVVTPEESLSFVGTVQRRADGNIWVTVDVESTKGHYLVLRLSNNLQRLEGTGESTKHSGPIVLELLRRN